MAKALICDDSPVELTKLRGILESAGWHTVTATTGSEAIVKARAEKPALIFLDVIMPDMDGFEACRQLQADAETKPIPVVFVTSKNQKADHLWARMQGAKALIGKPYEAVQILDTLKAFA
ncbi:PleD family two-component system response regulator [Silanimonas sp.]|jgi:twitching motility two-component system response regulator PilH|uniref:PleD family two-component system response regulator n=1 Tax=Silanimonas sp. TaxID=1929290 RepID=UPI0037CB46DE